MNASELLPQATASACKTRQARLQDAIAGQGLDALLVGCEKDIQYLTGFVGHDSLCIVEAGGASVIIISDSRYDEFLDPWRQATVGGVGGVGAAEVVMGIRHRLPIAVGELCRKRRIKRLGIQAEHVTLQGRASLAAAVGEQRLVETAGLVGSLRMRKDELEIRMIERAIGIQQDALNDVLNQVTVGMSELEFSAVLEFEMKSRGAHGSSFTPIIGAGRNSSVIHHMTGPTLIEPGVLLVDWGAMIDGYCGDMTRTFGIEEMPARMREVYSIVLEAQLAAIDAIAPGRACAEIDAVARTIIAKAGYGEQFGHGLGHGLGMDVHEPPYFNDLQTDVRLEPGMIMTVEPGIYIPGVGGVRIEDDVLVTGEGSRVLCDFPKTLESATVEPALSEAG